MAIKIPGLNRPASPDTDQAADAAAAAVTQHLTQLTQRLPEPLRQPATDVREAIIPDPNAPKDSFGHAISQKDQRARPDQTPLPQFVDGRLPTTRPPQAPRTITDPEPTPPETPPTPVATLTPDDSAQRKRTSQVVITIICVLLVIAVGIAIFWLWSNLNQQIAYWRAQTEQRNQEIQQLRVQLAGLQEDNQLVTSGLPVYVDPNGYFTFYKNIPSLSVSASGGVVKLFYGETSGELPVSGFVMSIEVLPTSGRALETIVNADFDHAPKGTTYADKRSENFADHFGFSYVAYHDNLTSVYYYLQDSATSKRYAKIVYTVAASSEKEFDYYERVALDIMKNLQLYEVD